ncbi:aspartyl-phosphate phosphatase Spo0E family protein [Halobacteroides halobius]|nr:aspartyl-phosphate phosphatase Spo0E family protein [Halobacteroides halobius]
MESCREKLSLEVEGKDLTSEEVHKLSQELDKKIVAYMKKNKSN